MNLKFWVVDHTEPATTVLKHITEKGIIMQQGCHISGQSQDLQEMLMLSAACGKAGFCVILFFAK